jgi:hypothetical protein
MNSDSLIAVMTVAVGLSAIAMVAMAIMVFSILRSITAVRSQVEVFLPKAESLVNAANRTLAENQQQIKDITTRAAQVAETAQKNAVRLDAVIEDAVERAKVQLERLELVMNDTVERVHNTVVSVNSAVLRPMREVSGVASGVKAAVQQLMRSNRPTPAQATSDEEMFI